MQTRCRLNLFTIDYFEMQEASGCFSEIQFICSRLTLGTVIYQSSNKNKLIYPYFTRWWMFFSLKRTKTLGKCKPNWGKSQRKTAWRNKEMHQPCLFLTLCNEPLLFKGKTHKVLQTEPNKRDIHTHSDERSQTIQMRFTVCLRLDEGHTGQHWPQALVTDRDRQTALEGHVLLFVSWVPAFDSVGAVGSLDRVDGRALFARRVRGVRRVGKAGPWLTGIVVKLHQAEYEVGGHEFKCIWRIGDDVPEEEIDQM